MPAQRRRRPSVAAEDAKPLKAGNNARALAKTLRALTGLGDQHAAIVQHARTLALLVDCVPAEPSFHREYREALKELRAVGTLAESDAFADLMAEINA